MMGECLRPAFCIALLAKLLLPTSGLVTSMLLLCWLGFRHPLDRACGTLMHNRAVVLIVLIITTCVVLCTSGLQGLGRQALSAGSFACALLIGGFLGSVTWLKMDADVGPYLRRRYISTVNNGSVRGVEAHEVLWAMYVSPVFMLSSGLFFTLYGWSGCLQANAAAMILIGVFHILCYLGTSFPSDERNLGAWGRPLPPRPPRTSLRGYRRPLSRQLE